MKKKVYGNIVMKNDTAALENNLQSLINIHFTIQPSYSISILKRNEKTSTKTNKHGCYIDLFIFTKNWKQPKRPSAGDWISKL